MTTPNENTFTGSEAWLSLVTITEAAETPMDGSDKDLVTEAPTCDTPRGATNESRAIWLDEDRPANEGFRDASAKLHAANKAVGSDSPGEASGEALPGESAVTDVAATPGEAPPGESAVTDVVATSGEAPPCGPVVTENALVKGPSGEALPHPDIVATPELTNGSPAVTRAPAIGDAPSAAPPIATLDETPAIGAEEAPHNVGVVATKAKAVKSNKKRPRKAKVVKSKKKARFGSAAKPIDVENHPAKRVCATNPRVVDGTLTFNLSVENATIHDLAGLTKIEVKPQLDAILGMGTFDKFYDFC